MGLKLIIGLALLGVTAGVTAGVTQSNANVKIKDLENCYFVIVKPDISIDTKTAYKEIDEKGEMTYTCKVCEKTKKEEIEKLAYREIEVDYVNGALYVPKERPLKVAQFADAHFGVDNKDWHNDKIDRSKEYMYYIVETTNPDFIVCSGDNVIGTGIVNKASDAHDLTEFVEFMESLEVPWTFMYGNHDAESKVKEEYSQF